MKQKPTTTSNSFVAAKWKCTKIFFVCNSSSYFRPTKKNPIFLLKFSYNRRGYDLSKRKANLLHSLPSFAVARLMTVLYLLFVHLMRDIVTSEIVLPNIGYKGPKIRFRKLYCNMLIVAKMQRHFRSLIWLFLVLCCLRSICFAIRYLYMLAYLSKCIK